MENLHRCCRSPLAFAFVLALGTIILATIHLNGTLDSLRTGHTMAQPEFLTNLQVDISQSTVSPHALSVSVRNTHPSVPVTVLKWNSPLDPAALGLGLLEIVPAGASEPIQLRTIKISRLMPPKAESLVTLQPHESATNIVELREPSVPGNLWDAGPVRVTMKGRWMAVWPEMTREGLLSDTERLQSVGAGAGSLVGEWGSGSVELS